MENEITYSEMCDQENQKIWRGKYYRIKRLDGTKANYSVILKSPDASYEDKIICEGKTLEYQGHDTRKSKNNPDPKEKDQVKKTTTEVSLKMVFSSRQ